MEQLIKISAAGVAVTLLIALLKGFKSELSPLLALTGSAALLGAVLVMISGVSGAIKDLFSGAGLESEHISGLLKIISAAYIADFAASLCKDMGESSLASKIELAGRVYIVMLAVPWAASLISAVRALGG